MIATLSGCILEIERKETPKWPIEKKCQENQAERTSEKQQAAATRKICEMPQ